MDELQKAADLIFLALTVWREARGQKRDCQLAVAYSILNRVEHPKWWGKDICSVVFARLQYSSMTYKGDVQLTTWPVNSQDPSWLSCLSASQAAINKTEPNPVPGADSYYDLSIPPPNWAEPKMFVARLGRIRFFNVDRDVER